MAATVHVALPLIPYHIQSTWRDTFIYASNDCETVLGGLLATEDMVNATLYFMVEIVCTFTDTFHIEDDMGKLVENNAQALMPDNYYILTDGCISVTDEVPLSREIPTQAATGFMSFRNAVIDRDHGCVITGRPAVIDRATYWESFHAAHMFLIRYGGHWESSVLKDCINIPPASPSHGTINSVQNGMLLTCDIHALFDSIQLSINPKAGYMMVCFTKLACSYGIAGTCLSPELQENPLRPPDELLAWHFHQAVLVNIKGA
ncbi:hypothetical protein HOY82DRAFT_597848 [Tuber indicum]|nr:hypothetical protein HOY82DRAFT_597848 [Tuber indicum]